MLGALPACGPSHGAEVGQIIDLLRDAEARVGYQRFDGEPTWLGKGWTGFDEASGVYWLPEEGESQVFMHCPWRGGNGIAFADYPLSLPRTSRIRLALEIGIRPTAKKTDGVTYRVKADAKLLFEQHCTWKEFRPFEVDLSAFAGKQVTLRLEVGPGPARHTSDDWSLWRNVRVLVGTDAELAAARQRAEHEAARRRAADVARGGRVAGTSLLPLTSPTSDSVCPGVLLPTKLRLRKAGDAYVFECRGDETIAYRFDPAGGFWKGLSVAVDGKELLPAPFRGGPRVHLDGRDFAPAQLATRLAAARLEGLKLHCDYVYTNPATGSSATLKATLWPEGKSLGIELRGEADRFSSFAARPHGGRPVPATFAVGGPPVWRRREGVYVGTAADLMRSSASGVHSWGVSYAPLTNGRRNAMHDVLYLTVTSRYEEALSNLTHKPSPFLGELARRVVLDAWGGSFASHEQWLRDMAAYGVDGLLVIKHVWQRDGYDRSYPNTMPANAAMGGDAALRSLSLTAQKLGHRFCVHENYYDYYPNAEDFREAHCALDPKGGKQPGWDRGPVKAVILKPSKLMDYVRRFSPEIRRRYGCNAAYHDIMPTWRVDFDARVADAGKIRVTHERTRDLCDYDRTLFAGPVVFEADSQHMAGVFDGGCNHGQDMYRHPMAVACELLKVHPRMSNHGFGYYERWLPWGYGPGWHSYVMTDRELDTYRAHTIAFGRTGFIGQQLMKHPHGVAREYHLMQAFGRAYTGQRVVRLRYQMDDRWVDAGTAARYGELARLHVEYEGGQHVYVNFADEPWQVARHTLPPSGTLTVGPRAEAWTALRGGQVADYARYGSVVYADARSHTWLPPKGAPPIEPSVAQLKHVGEKQFELTVRWKVGRALDRDLTVFWHFLKPEGGIAFQADHRPKRPTTTWKVGESIVDGPRRLSVKDDAAALRYDIAVGLYGPQGRVPLLRGLDTVCIGRLVVERDGEVATAVRLEPVPPGLMPGSDRAAYLAGANTARKVIDFGEVATNGAVVLRRTEAGTEIIPVPIGDVFTIGLRGDVTAVKALDAAGKPLPAPKLSRRGGTTWLDTQPQATRYVLSR